MGRRHSKKARSCFVDTEKNLLAGKEVLQSPLRYIYYTLMGFEFNPEKSVTNKERPGIDFVDAQALWEDPDCIAFPARPTDEERFALIAKLKKKLWVAFYTLRENKIRIISVRRARTNERPLYES